VRCSRTATTPPGSCPFYSMYARQHGIPALAPQPPKNRAGCPITSQTLPPAEDDAAREERKKEAEREQDQRDKEEFEARLKARDDEKTRRIVEQRIPKEDLEVGCFWRP